MNCIDLDYYRARHAAEQRAAAEALHPSAAESHRELAELYASLISQWEPIAAE